MSPRRLISLIILIVINTISVTYGDSIECRNRGDLSEKYCDNNFNLVADRPANPKKFITPKTLILSFSPFEDMGPYASSISRFMDHLESCLQTKVIYYQAQSNEAEIEAMRSGILHVAGLSSGTTVEAVNRAGAVPFAAKGNENGLINSRLIIIVRSDSPYQKPADLKGKRIAHTDPISNSGHLGGLALLPKEGIIPGIDYKIVFSSKHDLSVQGVKAGDYDAAIISSDVLQRMILRGRVNDGDFRIIYQSEPFPSAAMSYAYNLDPEFRHQLTQCIFDYRFSEPMQQEFMGADRFLPINYKEDWAYIRTLIKDAEEINRLIYQTVIPGSKND